jgi:hypothetical protein
MTTVRVRTQLLAVCLLAQVVGTSAAQEPPPRRSGVKFPALLSSKPFPEDPKDDELRKLLKERYNAALAEAREYYAFEQFVNGRVWLLDAPDQVYSRWKRLVESGLELCDEPAEKVTLLANYVMLIKDNELVEKLRFEGGQNRPGTFQRARFERLDAEVRLLRAKREAEGVKVKRPQGGN